LSTEVTSSKLDSHRCEWHRDRIEALLSGEHVAPITIDCALSKNCSYNCCYCYAANQRNDVEDLTRDEIISFLDDAVYVGVKGISFVSDGESTCNPNLYEAITYGKRCGIDMALGTNGYLLDDDRLEEILPSLTYIRFNISATGSRYSYIHGCDEDCYYKVVDTIKKCVSIKRRDNLSVVIGMQMVLIPKYVDDIWELINLGKSIGVNYVIAKHCSDNERGDIGIDYEEYNTILPKLRIAESMSTYETQVAIKWSKIERGSKRKYSKCYGAPLLLQFSGNGLIAPCGSFFSKEYSKYHISSLHESRFKDIINSKRYWDVMNFIKSDEFDARHMCATLCLQDNVNNFLWDIVNGEAEFKGTTGNPPYNVNFL